MQLYKNLSARVDVWKVTLYKKEECKQDGQGCDPSHHRQLHGDLWHFEAFKVAAISQISSVFQCPYSQ